MSTNRPVDLTPPTPPSGGGAAALAVPKRHYVPRSRNPICLSCGMKENHARGLCDTCYQRAWQQGVSEQYPACGAVPVPCADPADSFEGFPEGYTHEPTGWPLVPAFATAPHPYYPETTRWFTCEGRMEDEWSRRPVAKTVAPRNRPIAWPAPWHRPAAELQAEFFGDEAQAA